MSNENTYWNNNGKYETEYHELWKQVPNEGEASKPHIEQVRCISRIYYDYYNNGSCNWGDYYRDMAYKAIIPEIARDMVWLVNTFERAFGEEKCEDCWRYSYCSTCDDTGYVYGEELTEEEERMAEEKLERIADVIILNAWKLEQAGVYND